MHLAGSDHERLVEALYCAFIKPVYLDRVLRKMNFAIDRAAGAHEPYEVQIERVVAYLDSNDRVDDLVTRAREANPGNQKLRDFERRRRRPQPLRVADAEHRVLAIDDFLRALGTGVHRSRARADPDVVERELVAVRGKLREMRDLLEQLRAVPLDESATIARQLAMRDAARSATDLLDGLSPRLDAALGGDLRAVARSGALLERRLLTIRRFLTSA